MYRSRLSPLPPRRPLHTQIRFHFFTELLEMLGEDLATQHAGILQFRQLHPGS